jgi:transposase
MKKIPKQAYTAEFKELAVKRVKDGQAIPAVTKELGLNDQTLRNWIKAAAAGKLNGAGSKRWSPRKKWNSPSCEQRIAGLSGRTRRDFKKLSTRRTAPLMNRNTERLYWMHARTVAVSFLEA